MLLRESQIYTHSAKRRDVGTAATFGDLVIEFLESRIAMGIPNTFGEGHSSSFVQLPIVTCQERFVLHCAPDLKTWLCSERNAYLNSAPYFRVQMIKTLISNAKNYPELGKKCIHLK